MLWVPTHETCIICYESSDALSRSFRWRFQCQHARHFHAVCVSQYISSCRERVRVEKKHHYWCIESIFCPVCRTEILSNGYLIGPSQYEKMYYETYQIGCLVVFGLFYLCDSTARSTFVNEFGLYYVASISMNQLTSFWYSNKSSDECIYHFRLRLLQIIFMLQFVDILMRIASSSCGVLIVLDILALVMFVFMNGKTIPTGQHLSGTDRAFQEKHKIMFQLLAVICSYVIRWIRHFVIKPQVHVLSWYGWIISTLLVEEVSSCIVYSLSKERE